MSGTRLPAGAVGLANTATCGQNASAVGPGGNIRHCPQCGSVFWGHFCHMLPGWEALMVTRGRRRGLDVEGAR